MADCHLGRQVHVTVDAQKLAMGVFKFHCLLYFLELNQKLILTVYMHVTCRRQNLLA